MVITDVNQVVYQGDGVTTAFPFTFRIIDATDIRLLLIDADGTETDIQSDYFVDTVNNTVHYPGYAPGAEPPEADQPAPVQTGQRLVIYRELPITQEQDLGDKWPFFVIELALDKLTMILQQSYGWWGRTLKFGVGWQVDHPGFDATIPVEAGKTWRVNDEGTGFVATGDPDEAVVVANNAKDVADAAALIAAGAKTTAQDAKDVADAAALVADGAKTTAQDAKAVADDAKDVADGAKTTAQDAKDVADDAKDVAAGAKTTAQDAKAVADAAALVAAGAKTTAEGIAGTAQDAKDIAQEAKAVADDAKDVADAAALVADGAKTTAEGIAGTAQDAKDIAQEAKAVADDAKDVADAAALVADGAKTTAEGIAGTAQDAKDIAQEAKAVADDAKDVADGIAEEAQGLISKAEYGFLKRNTAYKVGDIAYTTQLPAGYYLECVTTGTTGNTEPPISVESENVNDGTVKWGVKNIQDASKSGLPVGFEAFTTNPTLQAGWLPLLGGEYSRTAYADLWAWVQTQNGYLLEESAWQAKAAANSGNVPFYSKGDGSTTFRVPALKCWVRGANSISEVGGYLPAGLPNITGSTAWAVNGILSSYSSQASAYHQNTGALSVETDGKAYGAIGSDGDDSANSNVSVNIDASRSSAIYGNSSTVQPESIVGMWVVKAYGTVTNVGSTDVANISTGLAQAETRIGAAETRISTLENQDVGAVVAFAGRTTPQGWLLCDGSAVSRTDYATLYAVIGTTYGAGNGSTTFNLPNLVDKFVEGSSTAGTVKSAGLPNITGTLYLGKEGPQANSSSSGALSAHISSTSYTGLGDTSGKYIDTLYFDASKSNAIYGKSNTVQPPALTMRYIIKY